FTSRRRHTRSKRDWSSDVCSSDLGAALPAPFSAAVAGLKEAGWLAGTISTGQSWGADFEAVTIHTGLLAARHVMGADIAVVAQGPGNLGTGTKYGYSGLVT